MSSSKPKHIHYSDNDWDHIITKYDLNNKIEIVTHEYNNPPLSSIKTKSPSWVFRTLIATTAIFISGNIPLQSQLISSEITHTDTTLSTSTSNSNIKTKSFSFPSQHLQLVSPNKTAKIDEDLFNPQELSLPKRAIETYVGHVDNNVTGKWTTYHVKSYDNLTNIFYKLGHQSMLKELQLDPQLNKELATLKNGSIIRASSINGELSELVFTNNNRDSYVITRNDDKYSGKWKNNVFEVRQSRASFTIKNGLFFDGRKAGIANSIIKQIVKVFDWDIDFSHDVRVGDEVTAVFEEIYHDGDKVGNRYLLAAEFVNKGREFKAIRYTYKDGKSDYFTPQGREMKKAFIRTPIAHARISSHFNPGRFHPVLHRIKAHKGTDFAARTGTPIMATGNGIIKSIGRKGGFGRAIVIQHREGYTTLYAHMSRFNNKLKAGSKVYQGDIIGYVGQTGLASGPHLHYEFKLAGKAIDPMKASLPNSMSLSSRELSDFRNKAVNLVLQLNVLHRFVKANIEINSAVGG